MKKYSQTLEAMPMPKFSLNRHKKKHKGNRKMSTNLIREWVLKQLRESPKIYGGDKGNPEIMKAYLIGNEKGKKVEHLTIAMFSKLSTVSRVKNQLLEVYPEYDYRTDKVKKRDRNPSLFDDVA